MSVVAVFLLLLALLFFLGIGGVYLALLGIARLSERRKRGSNGS